MSRPDGQFDSSAQPEQAGANCHKLIMFFSDGGTEWPGDVIDKYKNDSVTKVRPPASASRLQ